MPEIIIRRARDGREYGIQSGDFRRGRYFRDDDGSLVTFEEAGFKVVSMGDGSAYDGPLNDAPAPKPQGEHSSS